MDSFMQYRIYLLNRERKFQYCKVSELFDWCGYAVLSLQDTFDICRKTFASGEEMLRMSLSDKVELFFHDYSLVPLFAYENYIGAIPYSSRSPILCAVYFGLCYH